MPDFILLMHNDTTKPVSPEQWPAYFAALRAKCAFDGGSTIGEGEALRATGSPAPLSSGIGGYIRVQAMDLAAAKALVVGNPVYESGGTVEVRELPRD